MATNLVRYSRRELGLELGEEHSRLLDYIPGIYTEHAFLDGFLRLFESIMDPLDRQIDNLHAYFDPRLTPADWVPWLSTWVDLVLDENWPVSARRELLRRAAELYRRRGTASGLRDYLAIFLGVEPTIVEDGTDDNPFHFSVVIRVANPERVDQERVRRIIEEEKPAHTIYSLVVERS